MAPKAPKIRIRLEDDQAPAETWKSRLGWNKAAFAGVLVMLLVTLRLYTPQETLLTWVASLNFDQGSSKPAYEWKPSPPVDDEILGSAPWPPQLSLNHDDNWNLRPDKAPVHPHSFRTDPNPASTTYCTFSSPHSSSSKLVQYALIIDVYFAGAHIFIHKFNNCGPLPALEYTVVKETSRWPSPFFEGQPEEAARSLDILMDEAVKVVPQSLHNCTPVVARLPESIQIRGKDVANQILRAVESRLRTAYPFFVPKDPAGMSKLEDEGVLTWLGINYLMGMLSESSDPRTVGVLGLGPVAMYIVFAPVSAVPLADGDHKYEPELFGKKRVLYQHKHFGYGYIKAHAIVNRIVESNMTESAIEPAVTSDGTPIIPNPCLAQGTEWRVEVTDAGKIGARRRQVLMAGAGVGSFEECARVIEGVLAKEVQCSVAPCAFGGVYMPPLAEAFPESKGSVLLLHEFYDRYAPLVDGVDVDTSVLETTVQEFADLAKAVCMGREEWLRRWGTKPKVMEEFAKRPEWCLDLTWQWGLLSIGYGFAPNRPLLIGKVMAKTPDPVALGAALKLVGGPELE